MKADEWLGAFEVAARKGGMARNDVADAVEYYREAVDDRMEVGAEEDDAVAALGDVDEAARATCESLPPFRKAVAEIRRSRERTIVAVVLLLLGAVVAAAGVVLFLVGWGVSGFGLSALMALPPMVMPFGPSVTFGG